MQLFQDLFGNVLRFTWQEGVMLCIGGLLIYLAIRRQMEPALLLPMGFGAILVNLPLRRCFRRAWPASSSRCCSLSASAR